jgi:hypothetical protein
MRCMFSCTALPGRYPCPLLDCDESNHLLYQAASGSIFGTSLFLKHTHAMLHQHDLQIKLEGLVHLCF